MRLSSRTRAWATLVGAVVLVILAVLLTRGGDAGPSGTTGALPTRTSTSAGSSAGSSAGGSAGSTGSIDPVSRLRWIEESALDAKARDTLAAIRAGGPYRYPRNDGVTYRNANGVLPPEASGYYKEFTVVTPGASTRGARRIISGSGGEFYLTLDHYDSFRRIRPRA